ncbi:MAG: hypothetical protein QOJ71_1619 [Actinomycetota bacterium]|nr:hypothetical protein [Actinomycetota bacterium]
MDGSGDVVKRMIARFPEPLRPHLTESSARLRGIRTPRQLLQAFEGEYEHLVRAAVVPFVMRRPLIRRKAAACAFVASCAGTAASVEQAEELLALVSAGTLAAPGAGVLVTAGMLSTVGEAYAAGSVRVHQLRRHDCRVDAAALAADIRQAQLGDIGASTGLPSLVHAAVKGGSGRLRKRWAVGAVPIAGVLYSSYDASRTIGRVLRLPFPPGDDPCADLVPAG